MQKWVSGDRGYALSYAGSPVQVTEWFGLVQSSLRITIVQSPLDLIQEGTQRPQVDHAESCPPCGDATEGIGRCQICQGKGDARQRAVGRTINDPFLAPVLTAANQVK